MLAPLAPATYVHRNGKFGQAVMKGGRITRKLVAAWNFTLSTRGSRRDDVAPRKRLCRTLQQDSCVPFVPALCGTWASSADPALEGSEGLRSHACLGLRVMLGLRGGRVAAQLQECPFPEQPMCAFPLPKDQLDSSIKSCLRVPGREHI